MFSYCSAVRFVNSLIYEFYSLLVFTVRVIRSSNNRYFFNLLSRVTVTIICSCKYGVGYFKLLLILELYNFKVIMVFIYHKYRTVFHMSNKYCQYSACIFSLLPYCIDLTPTDVSNESYIDIHQITFLKHVTFYN